MHIAQRNRSPRQRKTRVGQFSLTLANVRLTAVGVSAPGMVSWMTWSGCLAYAVPAPSPQLVFERCVGDRDRARARCRGAPTGRTVVKHETQIVSDAAVRERDPQGRTRRRGRFDLLRSGCHRDLESDAEVAREVVRGVRRPDRARHCQQQTGRAVRPASSMPGAVGIGGRECVAVPARPASAGTVTKLLPSAAAPVPVPPAPDPALPVGGAAPMPPVPAPVALPVPALPPVPPRASAPESHYHPSRRRRWAPKGSTTDARVGKSSRIRAVTVRAALGDARG